MAIAFVQAAIERDEQGEIFRLREVRSGGDIEYSERQLVEGFFQYFERLKPRLVTFNGRSFDLPVLRYRAMHHGVSASWLYQRGVRHSSYLYRYDTTWHCDLMDALSDFGASKTVKLDEVSRLIGLPGKFGIDGSEVEGLFQAGELQKVRDYCETDVLNTYLVYLRYLHHCGQLAGERYEQAVADVVSYTDTQGPSRPHLTEFRNAWLGAEKTA